MKSAICAIARNECEYLEEWITYHLDLGFTHIFLYDNNDAGDDSVRMLLQSMPAAGRVTLTDYRGAMAAQLTAYNDCYFRHGKDFDWMAFIDIDEFITFGTENRHACINDFLAGVPCRFNVLAINWMYYGDNEEVVYRKEGVMRRFPKPAEDTSQNKHVKVLARTRQSLFFLRNPHCMDGDCRICDDCQAEVPESSPFKSPSYKQLYIRHYGTKTIEEFITHKLLRGAADQTHNPYKLELFYQLNRRSKAKRDVERKYFHIHKEVPSPCVSIIVPNYNNRLYLKECVESVLGQTFTDYELILLDNCSDDNSQRLLLSYSTHPRVSYVVLDTRHDENPFRQREKGIRLAKGRYVWILESHDSADSHFLEKAVEQMRLHPEAALCFAHSRADGGKGESPYACHKPSGRPAEDQDIRVHAPADLLKERLADGNRMCEPSMTLFRREGFWEKTDKAYRSMCLCGNWLFWIGQPRRGMAVEICHELGLVRHQNDPVPIQEKLTVDVLLEMAATKKNLYEDLAVKAWVTKDKHQFYVKVRKCKTSSFRRFKRIWRLKAQAWWDYVTWPVIRHFQRQA